jgi:hypothetical protein
LHWSGNFDEMQDFEHDMRGPFGGTGFLPEAVFREGTRGKPLGDKKAGLSPELDALAAYVASLGEVPPSPWRNADGSLTVAARRGKGIFFREDVGCARCHALPDYTDSRLPDPEPQAPVPGSADGSSAPGASAHGVPTPVDGFTAEGFPIHDVGTLKPTSGHRLGGDLMGLDTPGLKGLWDTAPYLHDGSAATLEDVLVAANPEDRHGRTSGLTAAERADLIAFLNQLDDLDDEGRPQAIARSSAQRADGSWSADLEPRSGGAWRMRIRSAPGRSFTIRLCDAEGARLGPDGAVTAGPDGTAVWTWDGKTAAGRRVRSPSFLHACSEGRCRTSLLPIGGIGPQ